MQLLSILFPVDFFRVVPKYCDQIIKKFHVIGRRRIGREEWEDVLVCSQPNSNRLDCETVLSYRSKASSFQPSRISVIPKAEKSLPVTIIEEGKISLQSVDVSRHGKVPEMTSQLYQYRVTY